MAEGTLVIDTIETCLDMEISNKVEIVNKEIIIYLADGTKAKIKTKNVV